MYLTFSFESYFLHRFSKILLELFARNDVSMIFRRHAEERFSQLLLFPCISIGWISQSQSFRSNTGHHSTPPISDFTARTTKERLVWLRLQTFSFFVMSLDGVFLLKSLAPSSNRGYFVKRMFVILILRLRIVTSSTLKQQKVVDSPTNKEPISIERYFQQCRVRHTAERKRKRKILKN